MSYEPEMHIECVEESGEAAIYVTVDGLRIAKRGKPGTVHAKKWVSIEPGYTVRDLKKGCRQIEIEYTGSPITH